MPANSSLPPMAKPSRKALGGPPPAEFKGQNPADSGNPAKAPKGKPKSAARNPFLGLQKKALPNG